MARVDTKISCMAAHISSLLTVTTSSQNFCANLNVSVPIILTATPSAKLPTLSSSTGLPAFSAACKQALSSASTPITFISGRSDFIYTAIPASKPPPPTGINTASSSFNCCISSRATVPWPTITSGSSNGGTNIPLRCSVSSSAWALAASK